ncbi:MAG: hypothetical protein ABIQ09_05905 [Jatrophihabitantaceae bacterium]
MSLRRIAGLAVAAIAVSGAGLLLSGPSAAVTPTPISLNLTGLSSTSCPLPLYGSIALKPATTVQFKPGVNLIGAQKMTLSVLSEAQTTPAPVAKSYAVPVTGVNVAFPSAGTYALRWSTNAVLGVLGMSQTGKLVISDNAQGCVIAVQVPVPSVSASVVPSPITSAINGGLSSAVGGVNGALSPVNSAIGSLPTSLPTLPAVPGAPGLPGVPGVNLPGVSAPAGNAGPSTTYKPTGPTVADRTVPKGYGSGSGLGGIFVPGGGGSATDGSATGNSITAAGQQPGAAPSAAAGSTAKQAKAGPSARTVEVASSRPRSALGALPTLAVILAILALSGATAFYARTFLAAAAGSGRRGNPQALISRSRPAGEAGRFPSPDASR